MSSRAPPQQNAIGLHASERYKMKTRRILRYGLAYAVSCGALWLFLHFVGRTLYAFDSHQVFFWLYAVSLLLLGMGARVAAGGRLTIRRLAKGAGLGLLAGLLAQVVVLVLEAYRFSGFRPSLLWQVPISLMVMSVALLTPLWGVVLVALTAACRRDNNPHQASNP
ncbi:hypothetical protein [Stenotrophomonas maltophilia]|uniref:hypothetical protein n=1 Tax=Stenotrophomonas maltophilia TaxID=40324 RepID=UPI002895BF77|nr:hypothetical protein [Stenotrophomonas maltophilia]MDT3487937.1 hypothetical protein [Stenotrophomonas maltophilia]